MNLRLLAIVALTACRRSPSIAPEVVLPGEALAPLPAWHIVGTPEDGLGAAISAGDVNGDGFDDVLAGAPAWHQDAGRALLFWGSAAGLSLEPTEILPDRTTVNFGDYLDGVGDVNGDGFDDVLVGDRVGTFLLYVGSVDGLVAAPGAFVPAVRGFAAGDTNGDGYADVLAWPAYDPATSMALYLGTTEGLVRDPTWANPWSYARSVASDLDMNGDGWEDLVIATQTVIDVYAGGPSGLSTVASSQALIPGDRQGFESLASVGDVNADGYDDLLTGAYCVGCAAYLFYGSDAGISAEPARAFSSTADAEYLGKSVDTAGDVDGDGFPDVVITGNALEGGGIALIYSGSSAGLTDLPAAGRTVVGSSVSAHGVGDLDADGFDDIVVSDGGQDRDYVYLGGGDGLGSDVSATIVGAQNDRLGTAVSSAGDVNGDAFGDVLVGAWGADGGTGEVQVFEGSAAGLPDTPSLTLTGDAPYSYFGFSVAGVGDVDGDGFDDVAVGSVGVDEACVYLGSPAGLEAGTRIDLIGGDELSFGRQVAGVGDVDGDGFADVAVGGMWTDEDAGWQTYIYAGDASDALAGPPTLLTGHVEPPYEGARLTETSVSGAGDANGDGFDDVAVATPLDGNGVVYLFDGAEEGLSTTASETFSGYLDPGHFGSAIAAAGDVNGDGYGDLVVGVDAQYSNDPGGGAVLCYGSASGNTGCSTFFVGAQTWYSVAGTGDLDDDGYDDIVVGGSDYKAPEEDTDDDPNSISVFAGAAAGVSSWATLTGPGVDAMGEGVTPTYSFRLSVAVAGDINGDRRDDLLVGAPEDNWGGGAAFLYLGGR